MQKTAKQKAIDNRANQLNPNNPAYHKSRMGNTPKKNNDKPKTVVIHHHHNHIEQKTVGGQTRVCPICGAVGNVQYVSSTCGTFGRVTRTWIGSKIILHCNSCGGNFKIDRKKIE